MSVDPAEAAFVRKLARERAAIVLDDNKSYLITARLEPLAQDQGFQTVSELVAASRASTRLQTLVVDAMTTNETSFFRDITPFDCLRRHVLPSLMAARASSRTLTIWSAACSTGQEPYSLALMIREHVPALAGWKVKILATDLSETVLARARTGRFKQLEVNRGLPAPMLVKYFTRVGMEWELKPEVRDLVEFSQLNLLDPWPARFAADVVFMRNVLIYFDAATKGGILGRLRSTLRPDGALFLGAAETTLHIDDTWQRVAVERATYYRRPA